MILIPIVVTLVGIVTDASDVQKSKAAKPNDDDKLNSIVKSIDISYGDGDDDIKIT